MQKSTTYDFNLSFIFRPKVNTATPPEKFNVEQHRTIIKYLFLQGKGAKQIYAEMSQTMGDSGPSCATVKHWVVSFKTSHFGAENEKPSGRPVSVSVPANVKAIHDMIMEDSEYQPKVLLYI